MAEGFVGADVQQLRDLAARMGSASDQLGSIESQLTALVSSSRWVGPDAQEFVSRWHSTYRTSLRGVSQQLQQRSTDLNRQAADQQKTSSDTGVTSGGGNIWNTRGGAAGAVPGGTAAGATTPEQALELFAESKKTDPQDVAAWWNSLSATERAKLGTEHPQLVGNLDGISYTDRAGANIINLTAAIAAAKKSGDPDSLAYLKSVRAAAAPGSNPPHQLISLTTGPPPLAAVSVGDLDRADYASFLVPGMGSNSSSTPTDLTGAATDLYQEQLRQVEANPGLGLSKNIAVVAWMDYDAPEMATTGDMSVFQGDKAAAGGVALDKALMGYNAVLNAQDGRDSGSSFLSVVGHSYGSTTAADALATIPKGVVDSFTTVASAGIEKSIGGAAGIHVPTGSVYSIQALEALPAAGIGIAGSGRESPYWDSFGSDKLSSSAEYSGGSWLKGTDVHDLQLGDGRGLASNVLNGYLDKGTTAQKNVALVNLGLGSKASPGWG
jgi:hypothetical protein